MPRLQRHGEVVHVAFDASKNFLVAGILRPEEETPTIERVFNDEPSIRRFVESFPEPAVLRTCHEAGPCGYELHRLLHSLKVPCEVIAPALIPVAPGDRVKTDKRDARPLVRQFRAGELVAIRVPSRHEEAVRGLSRARGDAVEDLTRAKNRLGHFLLRHGRVWRVRRPGRSSTATGSATSPSTMPPSRPRSPATGRRSSAARQNSRPSRLTSPATWTRSRSPHPCGGSLPIAVSIASAPSCSRPRSVIGGALPMVVPPARSAGWCPRSYSSGERVQRGSITHAGNAHLRRQLSESAWAYTTGPSLG